METKGSSLKRYQVIDFLWELLVLSSILLGLWLAERLLGRSAYRIVTDMVMAALGIGAVGLMLRLYYLQEQLDYDNGKHLLRFWSCFLAGGGVALLCSVLPIGGWPYVVIYVTLALFASQSVGILGASVLLMLSIMMREGDVSTFILYFISGCVATVLFRKLDMEFKVTIPLIISQMVLLVCETAYLLMQYHGGLELELFVVPFANVVVSSVLLVGIFKIFFARVLLKDRNIYSDLLNPDGELLSAFKQKDRTAYYQCMHTAYICDRIARKLELYADPVRTAGYYHKIGNVIEEETAGAESSPPHPEQKTADNMDKQVVQGKENSSNQWDIVEAYLKRNKFPEKSRSILKEFLVEGERIISKEATILLFADAVVSTISYLFSKDPDLHPDYDKLVEGIFRKGLDSGLLKYSSITQAELTQMRKIFKEEKLYYDFIRGK
jgi:membrane-associated HD superfamily phosphohydrolase